MLAMVINLCSRRVSQPLLSISAGGSLYSRLMEGLRPCLCSTLSTVSSLQKRESLPREEGAMSMLLSDSVFALTSTTLIMR